MRSFRQFLVTGRLEHCWKVKVPPLIRKILFWLIAPLIVIVVVIVVFLVLWLLPSTPPLRYEFAEAFRGWVVIQYGDARCPSLSTEDGYLTFKIPNSGCLCTATPLPEGSRKTEFTYIHSDGHRTQIPHKYGDPSSQIFEQVTNTKTFVREYFFVGPIQAHRESMKLPDVHKLKCKELD